MGVQLTQEEIDEFLTEGHTVILATTRKSGEPFMTPLWYVYESGAIYLRTRARSAKAQHIERDPRVCLMVEAGEKWVDLKAVIINCHAEVVEDEAEFKRIQGMLGEKYAAFRAEVAKAPKATKKHYAPSSVLFKCELRQGEVRSWYNRKLRGLEKAG